MICIMISQKFIDLFTLHLFASLDDSCYHMTNSKCTSVYVSICLHTQREETYPRDDCNSTAASVNNSFPASL